MSVDERKTFTCNNCGKEKKSHRNKPKGWICFTNWPPGSDIKEPDTHYCDDCHNCEELECAQ